jgi:uncharacterized repeat protein (TIGR02543 family)
MKMQANMNSFDTTAPPNLRLLTAAGYGAVALGCWLLLSGAALAAPVTADTATSAVQGWLHQDRRPLGALLSARIKGTEEVKDGSGENLYYVVRLEPAGFVIASADDLAEPVVAFSATGDFDASSEGPLPALVNHDLPRRVARARAGAPKAGALKSHGKWRAFLAGSPGPPPDVEENGNMVVASEIWVAPFVQTLWNQTIDAGLQGACFNYFTPPYGPGVASNYPCGCIATALAQELYYFRYPVSGVGAASFTITNNGTPETVSLLGGNSLGGPYQWNDMPLWPNDPTTNQAMAIGYLTHDAGAVVNMSYTPAGSGALTHLAQRALINTFMFENAAYCENDGIGISGGDLVTMMNPNLDAHLPVLLGVEYDGGHCVVCDGYGYSSSTLFHHLNMGYGGDDDVWYALPDIDTVDNNGDFTLVAACVYNIYTNGSGQIISGRVTDAAGAPVVGATVTAARGGGGTYSAMTDTNGIYALARVPSASTYVLTVTEAGCKTATNNYSTGTSVYDVLPSGNVWGANFVLSPPLLVIPETGFATIGPVNGPFNAMSQLYNLTNTSASPINWVMSNTNNWLSVTSTNGAVAAGDISILTISVNSAANSLPAGTYTGSIWITNLNNGLAQSMQFSLVAATADYPIAVTGYNRDVVVENTAVGGNTANYADRFDPSCNFLNSRAPLCFYEAGLAPYDYVYSSRSGPDLGLPQSGLITSLVDNATTFQLAPYDSNNVLYLTSATNTASLAFNTPMACKRLSVLAASAQGGGDGTLILHFADGTVSAAIHFNAAYYLATNSPTPAAAITSFGLLVTGQANQFGSVDNDYSFWPVLYQTSINLQSIGYNTNLISSATFTLPGADSITGIFALSGTEALYTGNYDLTASASPASGGTVSGGGMFAAGSTNTVTATANSGYAFINWTQGGIVAGTSSNYTAILNGEDTLVANFLPVYRLSVSASPAGGGAVTSGGTFVEGTITNITAAAISGFEFVGWTGDATGTDNPLTVTISTNLNITANFATNAGNITLTVLTNGFGSVSPNLNGRDLVRGRNYTLTATAETGSNVFLNWTGNLTANKNPLTFKAESNMVLQANFIPSPFPSLTGTYNGLFFDTNNGVLEQTAGMLKGLAIGRSGTYSGTLLMAGASLHISGKFGPTGRATNHISRAAIPEGPLSVEMILSGTPPHVTGTISGTNNGAPWKASLIGNKAGGATPSAEYTLLLEPAFDGAPTNSPGGYGYMVITNRAGVAGMAGSLADGTAMSQSTPISQDGSIPIYASLYGGRGLLLGWINLSNTADGSLTWVHPERLSGIYTNEFINVPQLLLSPWTNAPGSFEGLANLSILDTVNGGEVLTNFVVSISPSGKVSGRAVSGSITPGTGQFALTIASGAARVTGRGAILLNAGYGGGYFLNKSWAGAINLGP